MFDGFVDFKNYPQFSHVNIQINDLIQLQSHYGEKEWQGKLLGDKNRKINLGYLVWFELCGTSLNYSILQIDSVNLIFVFS